MKVRLFLFIASLLTCNVAQAWIVATQMGGQWIQSAPTPLATGPEGQTDDDDAERQTDTDEQWSPIVLPELREQSDDQDAE